MSSVSNQSIIDESCNTRKVNHQLLKLCFTNILRGYVEYKQTKGIHVLHHSAWHLKR